VLTNGCAFDLHVVLFLSATEGAGLQVLMIGNVGGELVFDASQQNSPIARRIDGLRTSASFMPDQDHRRPRRFLSGIHMSAPIPSNSEVEKKRLYRITAKCRL
jgi:hypothetical protein